MIIKIILNIKSKILTNLLNEKYELKLGEFNNIIGTERVKKNTASNNTLIIHTEKYQLKPQLFS